MGFWDFLKNSGIPIASTVGGVASALLGERAKSNQAKESADLYNNWLKQYMGTGQSLFNQAQAGGWNPFGPQTSTSTSSTTGGGSTSFRNNPFITEQYKPLDELMRGIMTGRLSGGSSLPAGYASNAARSINESYEGADTAARNLAARRGLSGEQSYAVASPVSRARAGALADMRGNLPLLERQMQNEDIGITQGLQSAFGTGQEGRSNTSSWSNTNGSQTNPFSASDLSALMRVLAPPSPQQGSQTGTSGVAAGIDSIGALLGFLSSQQKSGGNMSQGTPGFWNN
jgi:hypothetical protein